MATRVEPDRQPTLVFERALWAQGYRYVAGIDEAGRGAWAGPVVAAAVIFEPDSLSCPRDLSPVRDSKLLTPRQRDYCYDLVLERAAFWGVGAISSAEIDIVGIVGATRRAMMLAIDGLLHRPDHILVDAVRLPVQNVPQRALIKGDRLCLTIAAASVIAKVTRDRHMREMDRMVPGYGFRMHKGYGTAYHQAALSRLGPSGIHRHSFAPIAYLDGRNNDDRSATADQCGVAGVRGCGDDGVEPIPR